MSSPFTLYNNINTYVKEPNIACSGGDDFDDIKNLDLAEFLGIYPAGAQLSARQTTQKCQDECDIRSWCTAFVYGDGGSRAKECWLHNNGCGTKGTNDQFNYYTRSITPTVDTFVAANSCSVCPAGTHVSSVTSIPNDETSCQKCERGKCSAAGSTSCDLTCSKLPDGNGESDVAKRIGSFGGVIDDMDTKPKRHSKTQCYASQAELDAARLGGYGIRSYLNHEPRIYDWGQAVTVPLAECKNLCIADARCKAFEFHDNGKYTTDATLCVLYYACSILKPWSGGTSYVMQDTTRRSNAIKKYGPIEHWDLSEVTNLKYAFYQTTLNSDISRWVVSAVTDMHGSK